MNYNDTLLPNYLKKALHNHNVDNGYMLFHRFLDGREFVKDKKGKKKSNVLYLKNFSITDEISNAMKGSNNTYINIHEIDNLFTKLPGMEYNGFDMSVENSIVLGLGQQSVSETSMLIHPIYGVPFIPGQAFKGVVRNYCVVEFFESDEQKAMSDDLYKTIFGREEIDQLNTEYKGAVIFHDVFIVNDNFELCLDITNCHYPGYYQSGKKITDSESPIPIKFNVIKNAVFHFAYSIRKKDSDKIELFGEKYQPFDEMVKDALKYYGLGAKTAVGYGRFFTKNMVL
ncbi:type III-B CRISPR module RAMP protein Cmr6 [Clostridium sp. Bc-iso-3]|nr:type III-B CRISPR module RAMP protein Cmr6 [Clostridium sp. Bc-iso-3]